MINHYIDCGLVRYKKVEDKMREGKIRTYNIENPLILEEINEYLNRNGKYGFCKGEDDSDALCFFDNENIFAMTYTNGTVELAPSANPLIVRYIEKELNNKLLKKNN